MSGTSSDLIAVAILEALGQPGREGHRFRAKQLPGAGIDDVFSALGRHFDTDVEVSTESGSRDLRGVRLANDAVLIPYLVGASGQNAGTQGFAGTLRTHFNDGPDIGPRTLLVFDAAPVDTVLSASEDVALLPQLDWSALGKLAARRVAEAAGIGAHPYADLMINAWSEAARPEPGSLEALNEWLQATVGSSAEHAGSMLWQLGCFLGDSQAFTGGDQEWARSATLRRNLERWHAAAVPFAAEVRRKLGRTLPPGTVEAVIDAATPFGIQWDQLELRDLLQRERRRQALQLHATTAITGARAARLAPPALALWVGTATTEIAAKLNRGSRPDEIVQLTLGGDEYDVTLHPGSDSAAIRMPAHPEGSWLFGDLVIGVKQGTRVRPSDVIQVAVHHSDSSWFPVDAGMEIDPAQGGFRCETDPSPLILADGGRPIGQGSFVPPPEDSEESFDLQVEWRGETRSLPVVLLGTGGDDDEPDPPVDGDPTEDEPTDGDDGESRDHYASLPHAMLALESKEWPEVTDAQSLRFMVGQRPCSLSQQVALGANLFNVERAIFDHPDWLYFAWTPGAGQLQRRPDEPDASAFAGAPWDTFAETRAAYFDAARSAGSVYVLDPRCAVARAYVSAFHELLEEVDWSGRYRREWDLLLLMDSVTVAGTRDVLFAPTSPISVAFYAELTDRAVRWLGDSDVPTTTDIGSLGLTNAVPLVAMRGGWLESAATSPLLWRHYVPFSDDAPGVPERNQRFIAARMQFFLEVHPTYRNGEQQLSVVFHHSPDAETVVNSLKAFYREEVGRDSYELPHCQVTVIGGGDSIERDLLGLLSERDETESGREQTRVTASRVTVRDLPPDAAVPFAHVAFVFRSPGQRQAQAIRMLDRPPTIYVDGLATAAGRHMYADAEPAFAWGAWSSDQPPAGGLARLIHRSLELVGGQPHDKLEPGWTRMASTVVSERRLAELYGNSVWVVHLDRLLGIETFGLNGGGSRHVIDYEERADLGHYGFDGITATEQVDPYLSVISRALKVNGAATDEGLRNVLRRLNAVSGRWAIQMLHRPANEVLERIGLVSAIAELEDLDAVIGRRDGGTAVLIALDELLSRKSQRGLSRVSIAAAPPDGMLCDDLLLLWVPSGAPTDKPLRIGGCVIEVKYAGSGQPDTDRGALEVIRTRDLLHEVFNVTGSSRAFRARDLAELLRTSAARATTFGLGAQPDIAFDDAIRRVIEGDYQLDLRHWRGREERVGVVVSVEAALGAPAAQTLLRLPGGEIDLIRLGEPILRALIEDQPLPRPSGTRWQPLNLDPPAGTAVPGPAEPGDGEGDGGDDRQPHPDRLEPPVPEAARREPRGAEAVPPNVAMTWQLEAQDEVEILCQRMDAALQKYRLPCEPCRTDLAQVGPNIIRLRTQPLGALSISAIEGKARDLGREVGAPGAVIVTQEPGYICIDVPRAHREPVRYADVAAAAVSESRPGSLDFVLGVAPSGEIRTADLARLPHLLVAGSTGSGKSVFLRALLCHVLRWRGPERLRILLIDPKRLDFSGFRGLPHLETGEVVGDPAQAVTILQATIERERDRRLPILADAGVSSAVEYYEQGGSFEALPEMLVLVDEFADLASSLEGQARKDFLDVVQRYVQITRAFGIYMVLATQRPSVDVITGPIKANLPGRVALSLPSNVDSRTVLDRVGAEDLLGNGDMLFYANGQVERLQGVLATGQDVRNAVERWRS